jgi:signal transduction histidine kinase/DNA-binding response OmpR family regulator/predicted RNA-binding protein with RPS1 domain
MEKLNISQSLEVTVERVLPFGVFVRLPDGRRGYIRKRELDLDADTDPSRVTHKGERIKAIVLHLGDADRDVELSRRASLPDPWPEFAQRYQIGDTVRGSVRAIQPHGVFVRIQAGIDGFVPLEELAGISIDKPENVFWLGDDVEAVITRIQAQRKFISLSLTARVAQYDQALEAARAISQKPTNNPSNTVFIHKEKRMQEIDANLYEKVQPILVVEDDDDVRESLTTWLRRKGFRTSAAKTVSQAMAIQSTHYKVLIVDLNLLEYDGLELIQHLRRENNQANICIMSSPEELAQRAYDIEKAQIMEVFPKPLDLDDIERFLLRAANKEELHYWRADSPTSDTSARPAALQFSETQTLARLHQALADITSTVRAKIGLLFQLDPDSQAISIPVQTGTGRINPSAIYGLRESPVNDVIKQEKSIFENRIIEKAVARFDKLLNLLTFKSCIGVPITVQGEIHHAAFFFHPEMDAFPHARLREVQAGALLLSAILTDESIQSRLRSLNPMLLSGELAASFGHDVFNKITALELETRNLADGDPTGYRVRSQKLLELVLDLKNTAQAFQQMLRTKEQMEIVDANIIVQHADLLLKDLARKEKTQIVLKLAPHLPSITGNSILLQQAFVNIMLNAIQQMAQKAEKLRWTGKRILEVTSLLREDSIQIRFKDNGPGIHKESLHKIFVPGFSTRGGSGLGLYIARSFIQMLGGTLRVEETLVPLGSTFLTELPPLKMEDKDERTGYTPANR